MASKPAEPDSEVKEQECNGPDPESLAFRLWEHDDKLLHTRLNYWILTESLLLVASAAIQRELSGAEVWLILLVIATAGLILTIIWHGLVRRSWNWVDHWFTRARAIQVKRCGEPGAPKVVPPYTVVPREKEFPDRGFIEGGLSAKTGCAWLAVVFAVIWIGLALVYIGSLLVELG